MTMSNNDLLRNIYSKAAGSRQQVETFCWLGSLSVLLETVEDGAEVMWCRGRGRGSQQALLSEGVEPR